MSRRSTKPDSSTKTTTYGYDSQGRIVMRDESADRGSDGTLDFRDRREDVLDSKGNAIQTTHFTDEEGDGDWNLIEYTRRQFTATGAVSSIITESDFGGDGTIDKTETYRSSRV